MINRILINYKTKIINFLVGKYLYLVLIYWFCYIKVVFLQFEKFFVDLWHEIGTVIVLHFIWNTCYNERYTMFWDIIYDRYLVKKLYTLFVAFNTSSKIPDTKSLISFCKNPSRASCPNSYIVAFTFIPCRFFKFSIFISFVLFFHECRIKIIANNYHNWFLHFFQ